MKTNITKKVLKELKSIIDLKGYWSDECREFIDTFDSLQARTRLHNKSHAYINNYITL